MPSPRMVRSRKRSGVPQLLPVLAVAAALALAASARADVPGWPRQVESSSGAIVIYQPQAEDLSHDLLSSRAAFSLQRTPNASPTFGVLWFTERVDIDRDSSTVAARSLDVTRVRLPGITPDQSSRYEQLIEQEAVQWDLTGSLEELQAQLAATERERASVAGLDNTPPHILFVPERAILIAYEGAPTLEPIEGSSFEFVSNTPYAVVFDPSRGDYYLNGANLWYTAKDPLGPWAAIADPPSAVRDLVPPDTASVDRFAGPTPRVVTATEPTELISTDGPPRYSPLVGDELLYVTNTESDVVLEVSSQAVYVLLAGRWYQAASTRGPWTFVRGDELPASFKRVPADSPKGNILASVAGTDQADDAVADAEIPQTSAIRRDASGFEVVYDGDPQFEPIEGTDLEYAVNTDAEVILDDGRYYACDQGVWYVSDRPDGPWRVSDARPQGLEDIPPSCPVYNVMYVYVYDSTPDVIYTGYVPGYVGCYPYYGTVYYGTGHHYRPWRGRHHFYPRPATWGFYPRYNPWLSRWSFGCSYWSGFLRTGTRWHSSQHHAWRGRPPMWFGPGGYRRPLLGADRTLVRTRPVRPPRPGETDRAPTNIYNRPDNVVRVDRAATRLPIRQLGPPATQPSELPNDVFAGQDGKVYRRDEHGKWKVNEGRKWKRTALPLTPPNPPGSGGGTTDGGNRGENPRAERPAPRPMPVQAPPVSEEQPRHAPKPVPVQPAPAPKPGNLEREYHARERANRDEAHATPPPAPAPPPAQKPTPAQRREERKDADPPEHKR